MPNQRLLLTVKADAVAGSCGLYAHIVRDAAPELEIKEFHELLCQPWVALKKLADLVAVAVRAGVHVVAA